MKTKTEQRAVRQGGEAMTAPWANQPTPLVNAAAYTGQAECADDNAVLRECVDGDYARDLERRMRAAEALLMQVSPSHAKCGRHDAQKAIDAHLAAAREMDEWNTVFSGDASASAKDGSDGETI